ncbi:hypothetical protein [Dysgonomonas sp. 25]|uniref:hypothetical protein n=1 Tax=Dysgonomonas sp. 25 TaxID=2302933 RepID=UPI0013D82BEF|nr:hypothetical protein [Dysgonomonas sp. 25]NDV70004.1 hypothetical protein [Dysgonomonas sp. 25]
MTSIQFGTYTPPPEKKKLLIVKLEGPFDQQGDKVENPVAGHKYIFKAYTDTISPDQITFAPPKAKWGKLEKDKIVEIKEELFSFQGRGVFDSTQNCYIYARELTYEHMLLYAYLDSPSDKVSLLLGAGAKGFQYKGTKKWGQLQINDDSISGIQKNRRDVYSSHDMAGVLGADTIDRLKKETEENVRLLYEGKGALNLGTRDVLKEDTADLIIENFYTGGGKKISFDENTRISKDLAFNQVFKQYFNNYLEIIKEILEKHDIKTIEKTAIEKLFRDKKWTITPNFSKIGEMYVRSVREGKHEFYGLMGGTQTIKVDLDIREITNNTYKVETRMYIGDWYGSDWGDIYQGKSFDEIFAEKREKQNWFGKQALFEQTSNAAHSEFQLQKTKYLKGYIPSLNAFFMLQHYFGSGNKYRPFETEIIYKSENILTINGQATR